MSKYFNIAKDLARSLKRDNTIYGHETVTENAVIPSEEFYTGVLDKDGRIPYQSIEQAMDEEAAEDAYCGRPKSGKKSRELLLLKDEYYED